MKQILATPHIVANNAQAGDGRARDRVAAESTNQMRGQAVQGAVWFAPDFRELLVANGLTSFEQFLRPDSGVRLRNAADRENWRLELVDAAGRRQAFDLKVHRQRTWRTRLQSWLGRRAVDSPGFNEAAGAVWLGRCGVGTTAVAAWGQRLTRDGWAESFVLTEELTGYTRLDQYLEQFDPCNNRQRESLRRLMRAVARVARQFHQLGCQHREFFSCHLLVRETPTGDYDVRLTDLQRCEQRRFRKRWMINDLAQLSYSTCGQRVSPSLRLAFFKAYRGVTRLATRDKQFVRQVLARQSRITRRLGEY